MVIYRNDTTWCCLTANEVSVSMAIIEVVVTEVDADDEAAELATRS